MLKNITLKILKMILYKANNRKGKKNIKETIALQIITNRANVRN